MQPAQRLIATNTRLFDVRHRSRTRHWIRGAVLYIYRHEVATWLGTGAYDHLVRPRDSLSPTLRIDPQILLRSLHEGDTPLATQNALPTARDYPDLTFELRLRHTPAEIHATSE